MQKQEDCFEQKQSFAIGIPENKRRIAYGRVGKIEEPLGQRTMIDQIFKMASFGIKSDDIYFDFGSANSECKPALESISEMIKAGKVDSLIVTHADRIARRFLDYQLFLKLLREFNVELIIIDKPKNKDDGLKKISGLWPRIK